MSTATTSATTAASAHPLDLAVAPGAAPFTRIPHYEGAHAASVPGEELRLIREAAPRFRDWFKATGKPDFVGTFDLASAPYPTRFGTMGAAYSPLPFVTITNRLIVVRWRDAAASKVRTLLFEPTDVELVRNAPFYAQLARSAPPFAQKLISTEYGTVLDHLAALGLAPEDVDYLTFDHLHVQDVRRLVGTRGPAPDLAGAAAAPFAPRFPNAKLIVQRRELDLIRHMHPLQAAWFQPGTFHDLRRESLLVVDGDVLVGPGVALLFTPGHTAGNHSLCLHTDTGIWASSENVIATELITPEHSKIPGIRPWLRTFGMEVVLNANTLEYTAQQYNSVIKEKTVVDRSPMDERFLQFFPSSELSPSWHNPGVKPTFMHKRITHGGFAATAATARSGRSAA